MNLPIKKGALKFKNAAKPAVAAELLNKRKQAGGSSLGEKLRLKTDETDAPIHKEEEKVVLVVKQTAAEIAFAKIQEKRLKDANKKLPAYR